MEHFLTTTPPKIFNAGTRVDCSLLMKSSMDGTISRIAKKRKTSGVGNDDYSPIRPFSILDDASLRAVLLRTQASDLKNLKLCCKRFYRAIHSKPFKQARSASGLADMPESILAEQQTLDRPIASSSPALKAKTGLAKELYNLVRGIWSKNNKPSRWLLEEYLEGFGDVYLKETIGSIVHEITKILNQCGTREKRRQIILDSDAIHLCAAHGTLSLIKILLCQLLPLPPRPTAIVVNNLDERGLTPLMFCARRLFQRDLSPQDAKKAREFVESFIDLGADKCAVHAYTGLSALGFFRHGVRDLRNYNIADPDGDGSSLSEELRVEADRIEKLLTPDDGPTQADENVLHNDDY